MFPGKDKKKFPWRCYTKDILQKDYKSLINKLKEINISQPFNYNRRGMKCTNFFFQKERMNTSTYWRKSCHDFYFEYEEKVKKYNQKTSHDLFSTAVFLSHAPSQFPPVISGLIYKYFNAKNILDPYAGWGDRCIAAMALGIKYNGIDSNFNLKKPFSLLCKEFKTKFKPKIQISKCEKINLKNIEFDLVFTSPPFWVNNKLQEKYVNCELDYNIFLKESIIPIIQSIRAINNCWICLYIPIQMYIDIKQKLKIIKTEKVLEFKNNFNSKKTKKIFCFK